MKAIIYTFGLLILLSGCKKDTCNANLGDTFIGVSLDEYGSFPENGFFMDMGLVSLDTLPNEYFEDYTLWSGAQDAFGNPLVNSADEIIGINVSKTKINVTFDEHTFPTLGQNKAYGIVLQFPDRQAYIDCSHPGAGDTYLLNLTWTIQNTDNNFEIKGFSWEETFLAGPF